MTVTILSTLVFFGFFRRFLKVRYHQGRLDASETNIVRRAGLLPIAVLVAVLVIGFAVMEQLPLEMMGWVLNAAGPIVALGCIWSMERGIKALRAHRATRFSRHS